MSQKARKQAVVPEIKIDDVDSVEVSQGSDIKVENKTENDIKTNSPEVKIDIQDEEEKISICSGSQGIKSSPVSQRKGSNLTDISEDSVTSSLPKKDRDRKVSMMSGTSHDVIHHYIPIPYGRKLSVDPFVINPRKYSSEFFNPGSRKVSVESYYLHKTSNPSSRKTSMDAFYLPGYHHGRISVVSAGSNDWEQYDTFETLPHADNYSRDSLTAVSPGEFRSRPTLDELREDEKKTEPQSPRSPRSPKNLFEDELEDPKEEDDTLKKKPAKSDATKFGWIQGVLVRCLLNIFGVMLFLRLTWITGQAGIGFTSIIVLLSSFVTVITTLSMSAICTNGEVKGGGAYYMISRSLGPEFGGSIGIVFSLANAIAAAMYVVGFAETVQALMSDHDVTITGDVLNDVRIIGCGTTVLLLCIVIIGMEWEAKAQLGLLFILIVAIVNYFVGTFIPPSDEKKWKGVVGYKSEVFVENFGPSFRDGESFFSVFSIFFPAATGILAGANISGDLKDPQQAIPKGTILAIVITTIVYLAMAWTTGACMVRDAVGVVSIMPNTTLEGISLTNPTVDMISNCEAFNRTCENGLLNDKGAVGIASAFEPLILAGIFSATLSSALASMVGAPKVFQALGKDKLFPFLEFFAKGYGKSGEPRRGYILTFFICVAMTCIGALDLIAPIISNFFLMAYALINYSCFDASIANTPGFRPAFKYYSKWCSLLGAMLCLGVMFLINWWAALVTFVVVGGLYLYVRTKKPDVNWGSSTQAHAYREALVKTQRLVKIEEHVKNFRPQILVMSGYPGNRPALLDFVSQITKKQSLLISGHVFTGELSEHVKNLRSTAAYKWFANRNIKAFYNCVVTPTLRIGAQVLLQALGIGKLRPNTILMGYKSDWQKVDPAEVEDYFNIIEDAFDLKFGVGILRVQEGFDINKVPDECTTVDDEMDSDIEESDEEETCSEMSPTSLTPPDNPDEKVVGTSYKLKQKSEKPKDGNHIILKRLNTVQEGMENQAYEAEDEKNAADDKPRPSLNQLLASVSINPKSKFREKQYGTIDVWWLFDDGGLTLLIPYILSTRKIWKNCKLRVFCAGTKKGNYEQDEIRMTSLLRKFRIQFTKITIVPDLWKKPTLTMYREFETTIHKWRLRTGEYPGDYPWKISDEDLISHKHKTYRNIRLREQLLIHSSEASLIVMTLPVPQRDVCPAGLFMGWLETLTSGMPPMLLLRGNQESVLTYYS